MIDTVNATLYLNAKHLKAIQKLLETMQSGHINFETGKRTRTGGLRNLKIKINDSTLRVEGSLAKFHLGNNVQSLTHETTKLAVEELSDALSLPMADAQVNRLDLAQNLALKHPATAYYPYFGERARMQRLEQGKGLYYRNTRGDRVFYDKSHELKQLKLVYPNVEKINLLRWEVRYPGHQNICRQLNVPEMTVGKLCDPTVYRGLVSNWATEYDKIDKYEDISLFDDEVYKNPSKFCAQVSYKGIQGMGGQNAVMSLVKQAKERKVFDSPQQYASLKRKVASLFKIKDREVENTMVAEVTERVMDVLRLAV